MSETTSYIQGMATGAIIGGLVGAGLAFFLSPHTGAQNRKIVVKKFNQVRERFEDIGEDIAESVMEIFGEVSEATVSLYNDGRRLFEKQVRAFHSNWEEIDKDKYMDMIENIGEALEEGKQHRVEDIEDLKRYWKRNWRKIEAKMEKKEMNAKAPKAKIAVAK